MRRAQPKMRHLSVALRQDDGHEPTSAPEGSNGSSTTQATESASAPITSSTKQSSSSATETRISSGSTEIISTSHISASHSSNISSTISKASSSSSTFSSSASTSISTSSFAPLSATTEKQFSISISTPKPTPTPKTTLFVTPETSDSATHIIGTITLSPSSTNSPLSAAAEEGFWQNKGAVAGTFTALGIFILGIIAAFIILRKRRIQRSHAEEILYDDFASQPNMTQNPSVHSSVGNSPAPSVTELAMQQPMDAYANNNIQAYSMVHGDDLAHAAGTAYSHPFVKIQHSDYSTFSDPPPSQHQNYSAVQFQSQPQHYYIPPSGSATQGQQARGSVHSIDSFYGPTRKI